MNTKSLYKVVIPGVNGNKKEEYNVVADNVSSAISNLRWSKTFDDYASEEAKEWENRCYAAMTVDKIMGNIIIG